MNFEPFFEACILYEKEFQLIKILSLTNKDSMEAYLKLNGEEIFTLTSLVHMSICMSVKSLNFKFAVASFIVFKV